VVLPERPFVAAVTPAPTSPPLPPPRTTVLEDVAHALAEDLGPGDLTGALIEEDAVLEGELRLREEAVLAGRPWFDACFTLLDPRVRIDWLVAEGEEAAPGVVARLSGPARALLGGERSAINFLQLLSATATATRRCVRLVAHTRARILDTRKTLPGLRAAQKYATRIGGAENHRRGLYDAIMFKENHLAALGGIPSALARVTNRNDVPVVVEVETLTELDAALAGGASWILLDDFSLEDLKRAVARTSGRARLEASGGMDESRLVAVAETGVDVISIGGLTKHVRAVDFSLRCRPGGRSAAG
jgi:nicotinate-nucleotide pyrophosphorylase (carboxylating)